MIFFLVGSNSRSFSNINLKRCFFSRVSQVSGRLKWFQSKTFRILIDTIITHFVSCQVTLDLHVFGCFTFRCIIETYISIYKNLFGNNCFCSADKLFRAKMFQLYVGAYLFVPLPISLQTPSLMKIGYHKSEHPVVSFGSVQPDIQDPPMEHWEEAPPCDEKS